MAAWIVVGIVFISVVVWYGWHSTHNELTKKIDRETDPEARRELIKLQGQIDRGRVGFSTPAHLAACRSPTGRRRNNG